VRKAESRYVFDTNTLISAALFERSIPGRALHQVLGSGVLVVSPDTLSELTEVLGREKLDRYLSHDEREEFIEVLVARTVIVEPTEAVRACRDPRDDKFLELALEAGAEAIVTGDEDLLVLHPFRGVSILTPADFLRIAQDNPAAAQRTVRTHLPQD